MTYIYIYVYKYIVLQRFKAQERLRTLRQVAAARAQLQQESNEVTVWAACVHVKGELAALGKPKPHMPQLNILGNLCCPPEATVSP